MTPTIRTVLGDLDPAELGATDSHDHLFIRSPLLPGEELDDPAAAEGVLRAFAAAGGRSFVQWTPYGMGRGADSLAKLSRATGVHVVVATGLHQAAHYDPDTLPAVYDGLAERFTAELTTGLTAEPATELPGPPVAAEAPVAAEVPEAPASPEAVRAGLIKIACDPGAITAHTRRVMAAAADAHHATGAPIAVHLEPRADPHLVLNRLHVRHGVPPHRIILGHLTRLPDVRVHRELAAEGVYFALDSPSRAATRPTTRPSTSSPTSSRPATPPASSSAPTPPPAPPVGPTARPHCSTTSPHGSPAPSAPNCPASSSPPTRPPPSPPSGARPEPSPLGPAPVSTGRRPNQGPR